MASQKEIAYEIKIRESPEFALREMSAHYDQSNAVYRSLRRLAKLLDEFGIPYALIGALAMNQHGYARATVDIDLVMTRDGLEKFNAELVGRGYRPAFQDAQKTFRDAETQVRIEILLTGDYPGDGKPKPVSFPNPSDAILINQIHVVSLEKLIELKLASGLSAADRLKDLADVQEMIRALTLKLELKEQLDASVRDEYERLWRAVNETTDPYDEERNRK